MNKINPLMMKIAGVFGIISPFILFITIGISIYLSPWFSWTNHWLSDLGVGYGSKDWIFLQPKLSSSIFNFGLIISGLLGLIFSMGLIHSKLYDKCLCRLGSVSLLVSTTALIILGIFPKNAGNIHYIASIIFFLVIPFLLLFIGLKIKKTNEKKLGLLALFLGIVSLISFPIFPIPKPFGSNAIVEMIPIIALSIFLIIFGIRLYKQKPLIFE